MLRADAGLQGADLTHTASIDIVFLLAVGVRLDHHIRPEKVDVCQLWRAGDSVIDRTGRDV